MISNAGYMWHRKYVNWLGGKRLLIGTSEVNNKTEANFADQTAIYLLYDKVGRCIYVGQAGRGETRGLFDRLRDHAIDDDLFCLWERFTWFGFYSHEILKDKGPYEEMLDVEITQAMDVIEAIGIYASNPAMNRKRGTLADVEWFYQKEQFEEMAMEHKKLMQRLRG